MRAETFCRCSRRKRVKAMLCRACEDALPPIIVFPQYRRDPRVKLRACRSPQEYGKFKHKIAA